MKRWSSSSQNVLLQGLQIKNMKIQQKRYYLYRKLIPRSLWNQYQVLHRYPNCFAWAAQVWVVTGRSSGILSVIVLVETAILAQRKINCAVRENTWTLIPWHVENHLLVFTIKRMSDKLIELLLLNAHYFPITSRLWIVQLTFTLIHY